MQYAKPRSEDTETRDGQTLNSYRGDLVNSEGFSAAERTPDPQRLLRGYERAEDLGLAYRAQLDPRRNYESLEMALLLSRLMSKTKGGESKVGYCVGQLHVAANSGSSAG